MGAVAPNGLGSALNLGVCLQSPHEISRSTPKTHENPVFAHKIQLLVWVRPPQKKILGPQLFRLMFSDWNQSTIFFSSSSSSRSFLLLHFTLHGELELMHSHNQTCPKPAELQPRTLDVFSYYFIAIKRWWWWFQYEEYRWQVYENI